MPVEFLTKEQKQQYGCFTDIPNELQLTRYFHLDEFDLVLINKHRGKHNRLGFALQLASVRFLGTFTLEFEGVPREALQFIASQLNIRNIEVLKRYSLRKNTQWDHHREIKQVYGYRDLSDIYMGFRLIRQLYSRAWIANERPSSLFDFATSWLIDNKVLLPGVTILIRLIAETRDRADKRLWKKLASILTEEQKCALYTLLEIDHDGGKQSRLERLRKGPTTISGPSLVSAIHRYEHALSYSISKEAFEALPEARIQSVARYAMTASVSQLARMPEDKKLSILLAFIHTHRLTTLDDAIDILDMLITQMNALAKNIGQKKRLRTLKDLDKSALLLSQVCTLLIDDNIGDECIRDTIFQRFSKQQVTHSLNVVKELVRPANAPYHQELVEQYGRVRLFLPALLNKIPFKASPSGEQLLNAYRYLKEGGISNKRILKDAPTDIVKTTWKHLVFQEDGHISKQGYCWFCRKV